MAAFVFSLAFWRERVYSRCMGKIKDTIKKITGMGPVYGSYQQATSVHAYLLDMGWTEEQIRAAAVGVRDLSPRTWGIVLGEPGADGLEQVGVVYYCDYKYEEEAGGAGLRAAFGVPRMESGMATDNRRTRGLVRLFDFPESEGYVEGLASSEAAIVVGNEDMAAARWGEPIQAEPKGGVFGDWRKTLVGADYARFWEDSLRWSSPDLPGQKKWWRLENHTVAELKSIAADLGVEVVPAEGAATGRRLLKADYVRALEAKRNEHVRLFPGYFQTGSALVLRAYEGSEAGRVAQDVLKALWMAYRDGALGFGAGGSGPFSTGLSLMDVRDLPVGWVEKRRAERAWVEAQERALEPVAEELRAAGHKWYFLGNPSQGERWKDGEVHYWLNGYSYNVQGGSGGNSQPSGWYTLEELRTEKFVADLAKEKGVEISAVGKPRW